MRRLVLRLCVRLVQARVRLRFRNENANFHKIYLVKVQSLRAGFP